MDGTAASTTPVAAPSIDELADELIRRVEERRRYLKDEKEKMMLEFEAKRVQLHTEYSSRLLQADEELRGVVEERQLRRQLTLGAKAQDVVTLDVGGKLYTVKRETLCLCRGSFLAELFSGRWDSSLPRDKANHIFLDIDPEVFDVLLAWLRDCKIGQSAATAPSGTSVAPEKMQHFQAVVDFFGLRPYLSVKGFGPDAWGSKTPKEVTEVVPERSFLKVAGSFLPWRMAVTPPAPPTSAASLEPGMVPAPDVGVATLPPAKVVGWSQKNSDPLVEHEEVNVCCLPDTRKQRKCCTARSTRGYQSGVHRFGVRLLNSSNCAVGLVCSEWSYDSEAALGHLGHSGWAVASDGSTWAEGRELERLPIALSEGTLVVFNLELGAAKPLRSATLELNGVLFRNVFTDLPETVYPAVSNTLGAPGRFQLLCDADLEAAVAAVASTSAAKESAG